MVVKKPLQNRIKELEREVATLNNALKIMSGLALGFLIIIV